MFAMTHFHESFGGRVVGKTVVDCIEAKDKGTCLGKGFSHDRC
jgi:hypothetical protein